MNKLKDHQPFRKSCVTIALAVAFGFMLMMGCGSDDNRSPVSGPSTKDPPTSEEPLIGKTGPHTYTTTLSVSNTSEYSVTLTWDTNHTNGAKSTSIDAGGYHIRTYELNDNTVDYINIGPSGNFLITNAPGTGPGLVLTNQSQGSSFTINQSNIEQGLLSDWFITTTQGVSMDSGSWASTFTIRPLI